jgi:hypothetical protein
VCKLGEAADEAGRSQVSFLRLCLERSGKPVIASGDALTKLPRDDGESSPGAGGVGNKVTGDSAGGGRRHAHFDADGSSHGGSNQPGASSASPSSKKFGQVQSWMERSDVAGKQAADDVAQAPSRPIESREFRK